MRIGKLEATKGREDLLYKEYMHPLYGASFSYPQAVGVGRYPEASGGRAGYMGGGITGIRKPNALPPTGGPQSGGLPSLYNNVRKW